MPGVVSRIDWEAGSRPRSRRRSMRPAIREAGNGGAGSGVERVEVLVGGHEQATLVAARPVGHAAVGAAALELRVERPLAARPSRRRAPRRGGSGSASRARRRTTIGFTWNPPVSPVSKRHASSRRVDVGGGDLAKRRVAIAGGRSAVDPPLGAAGCAAADDLPAVVRAANAPAATSGTRQAGRRPSAHFALSLLPARHSLRLRPSAAC